MSLNKVLKELEKEKALRNSLFKITHEIKNPLAVCKGYLDMIDLTNISKASKYHNIIKNEIERTLSLMDDFLDYTKIKVVKEEMDVSMLLEDVIKTLKPLLLNSKITLKESIEEEVYLNGDYNRLKQVLINLIKNSIEAINNDKGIILLNLKETKSFVNITIIDNGCGMNKETLEKIKETFFTTKQKGTGLGVTLSNEIIKLHNGSLKYTSKINKGTKVTINLHK